MIQVPGIDLNARDKISRNSSIWWAALHDSQGVLASLLERPEADVNLGGDSLADLTKGTTPLLAALWNGHESAANLLIDSPAIDINAQDAHGVTALTFAIRRNMIRVVPTLLRLKGIDINCRDDKGWAPLAHAASGGFPSLVETLLAVPSIDPNCQTGYGDTPLMLAAVKAWSDPGGIEVDHSEWLEILGLLLKHEATDVNIRATTGYTALSAAAASDRTESMEVLFTAPTLKVNLQDSFGMTALSLAVSRGKFKAISLLLCHPDIDIKVRDKAGRTVLFLAVFYAYIPAIALLLAAKDVNASIEDYQGRTPLAMAKENFSMTDSQWRQRRHDKSAPSWSVCRNIIELLQPPRACPRDKSPVACSSVSIEQGPFELQGTDSWLGTIFMPCELEGNNSWPCQNGKNTLWSSIRKRWM
jgi:ankyrin repeat protein